MRILGIIPARGGSKGVPYKNRKLLEGKPLMQYTVEAALQSKELDDVIFSSEDATLIGMAKNMGVEVPFIRPATLATDSAGSLEVVQHAISFLKDIGRTYDAVCLLQVTTPFRSSQDIDMAIHQFKAQQTDALISVQKVPHEYNPHWVFEERSSGHLKIATGEDEIIKRRQDLPDAFIRDGSIYITKSDILTLGNSFYGETLQYILTDSSRYVNIDTLEDWEKASRIAKRISNE
ncbi:cytidylyltransferase domain-containing protein [Dokdonia sp. Hel_I_53]|uniref:acylneuraminate cytidylyltransferase family protein n=1 Tax=Dokdonia sp. Hel_I_53 TaxID=1566287 RepID=UPI00119B5D5F|nr:acylneuraminate cytidylyltransferase family protein [Dokdonia sp. Hel_I_53]TVZ53397.1 N-acylneuraminate cytidylyltransferase/CMP-N,N'-diacetyllegionaminic acid synthase [Dokdonia sp. Hel_I_53]